MTGYLSDALLVVGSAMPGILNESSLSEQRVAEGLSLNESMSMESSEDVRGYPHAGGVTCFL